MKVYFFILALLMTNQLYSQNILQTEFEQIANGINGELGVSALHIESGMSLSFNGNKRFPMQSVYKFPIAMVMLHQVDTGEFSLKDTIRIDESEYISKAGHSPIRDAYPNGVNLTLEEILEYNVSQSDGTACDVLLRLLGGTDKVQKSIRELGVNQIAISTTEMVQVANDTVQYQNWATPEGMNELLQIFHNGAYLSESSQTLLLEYISISNKYLDRRIKGLLPPGTKAVHKTGTAGTYGGFTRATNDAGIITLPNGTHLAISVFVADSYDPQKKREMTIANVAKTAYDFWSREN